MIDQKITEKIIAEHGLTSEEYQKIISFLGREPNIVELGICSVMWSEHCSYKSSRRWLKTLPTTGKYVVIGPGENAGAIDIGDNQCAIFKMESHNHPSYIEPYQGAATGVGGIMRDIFTMGARPIANLNALRFGDVSHQRTPYLLSNVVAGIAHYGNCMGVPTITTQCEFDKSYNGNILVNAMTVGIADRDKIFTSAAAGIGNKVVYVGAKTGRDGIHGATMASTEFDDESDALRPTVQVGDPFSEKLLLEACLELMAQDVIIAIQDMGAAGLTSSSVEMADKGDVGILLDLDKVPQRETGMTAYEMMLSESQERMLMVIKPGGEKIAYEIFKKWNLDIAVIGEVTDSKSLQLQWRGELVCDLPIAPMVSASPLYDRPYEIITQPAINDKGIVIDKDWQEILCDLLKSPNLSARDWIMQQYDHIISGDILASHGGDSAVIKLPNHDKALAMVSDCTPRYCYADPVMGGKQAVVENWRNLICRGAQPIAVTNNLNFGNPEKPNIMGQMVGAIQGMGEACKALDYPVISGNVSLYNETNSETILPTPVIGGVGVIHDLGKIPEAGFIGAGQDILLIGDIGVGHLQSSRYQEYAHDQHQGTAPAVDLAQERKIGLLLQRLIKDGLIITAHDISAGGLVVALAQCVIAGQVGCDIALPKSDLSLHQYLFGEDQGRYIVTSNHKDNIIKACQAQQLTLYHLGITKGDALMIQGHKAVHRDELVKYYQSFLPTYMSQ